MFASVTPNLLSFEIIGKSSIIFNSGIVGYFDNLFISLILIISANTVSFRRKRSTGRAAVFICSAENILTYKSDWVPWDLHKF